MSGFERSMPVPGSQGPRRSEMRRYNNAPPPESAWRLEVLEAKKAAEAAMRKASNQGDRDRSKSKSRSRSRSQGKRRGKADKKEEMLSHKRAADVAVEKGLLLRNLQERQGFYAAVARASKEWESVPSGSRPQVPEFTNRASVAEGKKQEQHEPKKEKKRRKDDETGDQSAARRRNKEMEERQAREEYETRAAERIEQAEQEKKKAEEERRKANEMKDQRKSKLKGAFAMDEDDDDDKERDAAAARVAARKMYERKRQEGPLEIAQPAHPGGAMAGQQAALALGLRPNDAEAVGKNGAVDPAIAFMKLQERKRKGRSSEFGGPPKGSSPWRDGRKGITFEEKASRR